MSRAGDHPIRRSEPGPPSSGRSAVAAAVLIIAAAFHLYRGVPVETLMFGVLGVAVAADGWGWLPRPRPRHWRLPGASMSIVIGCLGAVALSLLPIRSSAEAATLGAIGVSAIVVAWRQPDSAEFELPAGMRLTALLWTGVLLTLALSQLVVYLLADPPLREYQFPNLTVLWQPVIDLTVWRAAGLALWLIGGLALLRWSQARAAGGTPVAL